MPAPAYRLRRTDSAAEALERLEQSAPGRANAVKKALGRLEADPRYPSLHTHEFKSLKGPKGEKVFEAYAENNRPRPYRIFFYYEPDAVIVVTAVVEHPE